MLKAHSYRTLSRVALLLNFFYLRLNLFVDQKPHSWKTRANKRTQWRDALVLDITKIDKTRDVLN